MPNIRIVPATERDLPTILELIRALADYEKLADKVTATEERLRATLFGPQPAAEVLLARDEGECVGFAVFFSTYSTFMGQPGLFLEDLYVKPHRRGHGIGLALLKRIGTLAMERGCGKVEWEVLNWNEPAIRFYRKLGAEPLDEWTKYGLRGEALERLSGVDG